MHFGFTRVRYRHGPSPWVLLACLVLVLLVVTGCAGPAPKPDLARMYRAAGGDATPVIVVPGLFGSRLRHKGTGEEAWPGKASTILFSDYRGLALDFDPETLAVRPDDLEPAGIADRVLGQDYYGPILDTLSRYAGYVEGRPGTRAAPGERRYYIFAYDWRQDNVVHARALDDLIEQVRRDYGDPALRVDIVAHSMGGLIARYYLRYGPVDTLAGGEDLVTLYGTSRVRKLVLLGTPNFGAASSLHAFLQGEPVGFARIPPEVIATMPSGYELFPHPLVSWLIDMDGNHLPDPLFDAETWRRYRWSVFDPAAEARVRAGPGGAARVADLQRFFAYRLERARRFMWMLSTQEPDTPIRYVLFGGNCAPTPARIALEWDGGVARARLDPAKIAHPRAGIPYDELMREPGDGRVTKPSFLARDSLDPAAPQPEESFIPIAYWFFLCEQHDQLTSNPSFQDNLLNVLLSRELPWDRRGMAP